MNSLSVLRGPWFCGAPYVEPLHGLSYVDPAYVDPRGAPYVDSLTWTLLMWTPLRGAPYVDSLHISRVHVREST